MRNLLHDQVTHPDSPEVARRWNDLCANERDYRQQREERDPLARASDRRRALGGGIPLTPMTDLLLTHGYFLADDEKERQIMKPYPPLGLLYLSAYLKRAGFSVEVFDSTFEERAALAARFAAAPGGVVGIYTNLMTRRSVLEIVRAAKQHRWTVILGGPESANYIAEYLGAGADVIVTGEGEVTLTELLPATAAPGRASPAGSARHRVSRRSQAPS